MSSLRRADREEARSSLFALGMAAALILILGAGALLLPIVPCPVCPPNIFFISTNVMFPGMPVGAEFVAVDCPCRNQGGRVSALLRWRYLRALADVQRGG